jgi:hypothetical protein
VSHTVARAASYTSATTSNQDVIEVATAPIPTPTSTSR